MRVEDRVRSILDNVATRKVTDYNLALIWLIPPLGKGGKGGFSYAHLDQIPLSPPFSKGEVVRNLVNILLCHGTRLGIIHAS
jgi:hypothetical protein